MCEKVLMLREDTRGGTCGNTCKEYTAVREGDIIGLSDSNDKLCTRPFPPPSPPPAAVDDDDDDDEDVDDGAGCDGGWLF